MTEEFMPSTCTVGETVTCDGAFIDYPVGGKKPVTYQYYFKRTSNSKWNSITPANSTASYAKFTPTAETSYDLKVVATDSKGTTAQKIVTINSVK